MKLLEASHPSQTIRNIDPEDYKRAHSYINPADNPLARALNLQTSIDRHNQDVDEFLKHVDILKKFELDMVDQGKGFDNTNFSKKNHEEVSTKLFAIGQVLANENLLFEDSGEKVEYTTDHLIGVLELMMTRIHAFHFPNALAEAERFFEGHI